MANLLCRDAVLRGPQSDCSGLNQLTYQGFHTGSGVNWFASGGTVTSFGLTGNDSWAIVNWSSSGTRWLAMELASGCTDTIYFQTCCDASAEAIDVTDKDPITYTVSVNGSYQTAPPLISASFQTIHVEGELMALYNSIEFDHCDFIMGPGAVIYTPPPPYHATFTNLYIPF